MRLKFSRRTFPEYKNEERPERIVNAPAVHRILDQTKFDDGNDGGCQTAAIYAAVEAKTRASVEYGTMREFYFAMDAFWRGKGEKLRRVIQYAEQFGILTEQGRLYPADIVEVKPSDVTFDVIVRGLQEFDAVIVSIGTKRSTFFSPLTGRLYKNFAIPMWHVLRVAFTEKDSRGNDVLFFQNSWGDAWGKDGFGVVPRGDFSTLRFGEVYFFNLQNADQKLG